MSYHELAFHLGQTDVLKMMIKFSQQTWDGFTWIDYAICWSNESLFVENYEKLKDENDILPKNSVFANLIVDNIKEANKAFNNIESNWKEYFISKVTTL